MQVGKAELDGGVLVNRGVGVALHEHLAGIHARARVSAQQSRYVSCWRKRIVPVTLSIYCYETKGARLCGPGF